MAETKERPVREYEIQCKFNLLYALKSLQGDDAWFAEHQWGFEGDTVALVEYWDRLGGDVALKDAMRRIVQLIQPTEGDRR